MHISLFIVVISASLFLSACSNDPEPNNFISNTHITGQAVLYTEKSI